MVVWKKCFFSHQQVVKRLGRKTYFKTQIVGTLNFVETSVNVRAVH